jgi:hypothetical protein
MNVATAIASSKSSVQRACVGLSAGVALALAATAAGAASTETNIYYQCPGNVFTNTITAKEADAKGCKAK